MAGAMRKMAVYLGLVEDDGYDGPGFDPDDEFEPEPEPERTVVGCRNPPATPPAAYRTRGAGTDGASAAQRERERPPGTPAASAPASGRRRTRREDCSRVIHHT